MQRTVYFDFSRKVYSRCSPATGAALVFLRLPLARGSGIRHTQANAKKMRTESRLSGARSLIIHLNYR